nr:unnamed protein product [Callosobruchus chinensis]
MSLASFSEQCSVASYTSVTNRVSRIASPISLTTLSPATACVVEYFQLHCLSNVRSVIYHSSVVAGDTLQISQHKKWGSVATTVRSSENEAFRLNFHLSFVTIVIDVTNVINMEYRTGITGEFLI